MPIAFTDIIRCLNYLPIISFISIIISCPGLWWISANNILMDSYISVVSMVGFHAGDATLEGWQTDSCGSLCGWIRGRLLRQTNSLRHPTDESQKLSRIVEWAMYSRSWTVSFHHIPSVFVLWRRDTGNWFPRCYPRLRKLPCRNSCAPWLHRTRLGGYSFLPWHPILQSAVLHWLRLLLAVFFITLADSWVTGGRSGRSS